ncbi:MAG: DNA recombination protein RmuC, partial [Bacteroidota bacterium]
MDTTLILLILIALLAGALVSWLLLQVRLRASHLPLAEVERDFVRREIHEQVRREADLHHANLQEKTATETRLSAELATVRANLTHLQDRLNNQATE